MACAHKSGISIQNNLQLQAVDSVDNQAVRRGMAVTGLHRHTKPPQITIFCGHEENGQEKSPFVEESHGRGRVVRGDERNGPAEPHVARTYPTTATATTMCHVD